MANENAALGTYCRPARGSPQPTAEFHKFSGSASCGCCTNHQPLEVKRGISGHGRPEVERELEPNHRTKIGELGRNKPHEKRTRVRATCDDAAVWTSLRVVLVVMQRVRVACGERKR